MTEDEVIIFVGSLAVIAVSVWMVFFKARIPIPEAMPGGFTRSTLEILNDWLRLFGAWTGCFCLPVAAMLALGVLAGGMAFWHWPIAILIFAVMAVWRMR